MYVCVCRFLRPVEASQTPRMYMYLCVYVSMNVEIYILDL